MKQKPILVEWFAVGFIGKANVACRQCTDEVEANAQCQTWKADHPEWRVVVRRVAKPRKG